MGIIDYMALDEPPGVMPSAARHPHVNPCRHKPAGVFVGVLESDS